MPYKVIGFFAREHGLSGFKALLESSEYKLICVFTHRLKPKSEDPERAERIEFKEYKAMAELHQIPLYSVDNKQDAAAIDRILQSTEFDLIASISWRRLISESQLQTAKIGCVNLHRGRLPDYPGAEPIKQALDHGDQEIVITAHEMTAQIDEGHPIAFYHHPVNYQNLRSQEDNIERLKKELTPHFGPLLIQALDGFVKSCVSE